MEQEKENEKTDSGKSAWDELRFELQVLDKEYIEADGITLKPSQCYRITDNKLNVIYNTNCPDALKDKIESILLRYAKQNESYPPQQEFFFP